MIDREFWKGKKVFLTGHSGFKGSWLALWFAELEAEVIGYSLPPDTNPSLFGLLKLQNEGTHYWENICDVEILARALAESKPDIVVHMAAQTIVSDGYANPILTYATNVMGTANLLEACRRVSSIRAILNITTDKCYQNMEWDWGYRESDQLGGSDPYSNSKACSELVTSAFRSSYYNHDRIATARAGNVIGGGDWAEHRLIPDIIRAVSKNEILKVRYPDAIRPWQHVLEPLCGYLTLIEKLAGESDSLAYASAWNFGPNQIDFFSVKAVVDKFRIFWGDKLIVDYVDDYAAPEAGRLILDSSKALFQLGWRPLMNFDETISWTAKWYAEQTNSADLRALCLRQIKDYEALSNHT
jgi:CDP-glucose 4,6-dehydratase